MALGNWESLSFTEEGKPAYGVFETPMGIRLEIYKNWLYVHDPAGWKKGGHFVRDTVMQIDEGTICYKDLNVMAVRGPRKGVYFVAWNINYNAEPTTVRGLVGLACYAFKGHTEVPIEESQITFLMKKISLAIDLCIVPEEFKDIKLELDQSFNQGMMFIALGLEQGAGGKKRPKLPVHK